MELRHTQKVLASGLNLITVPMQTPSVTVLAMVRVGSRDEEEPVAGVAHFLEHFVFKGTKNLPGVNDVSRVVDRIGGKINAFTSTDYTGFWVKVANTHLETGMEVVAQLVTEPLLPEEELEKEKGTVIEEIKMYEDNFPRKAVEEMEKLVFPGSPLSRPTLGFVETINSMKIENLRAFRDRWYFAENVAVVLAGDLTQVQNVEKLVEEKFGSLRSKKEDVQRNNYGQVFTQNRPKLTIARKKTEQAHLSLGLRSFAHADERNYALMVLDQILGGNMSSRLWTEIREKRGLAYYVRSGVATATDHGVMMVRAGVKLEKVEEAVKVIREELLKMKEIKISEEELDMGREGIKGNLKLDLEDSQEVAMMIADDWALMDKIRPIEEILDKVSRVEIDDVLAVAGELIEEDQLNLAVVGPFKDKTGLQQALEAA